MQDCHDQGGAPWVGGRKVEGLLWAVLVRDGWSGGGDISSLPTASREEEATIVVVWVSGQGGGLKGLF